MKFLLFFMVLMISIVSLPTALAEETPDWVKNTAGWWASDTISEKEFVNAIQFLVNEGIIQVSTSNISEKSEKVPDWVKNTAGWWASDTISEKEFVNAIQFLVNEGILEVDYNCKFFDDKYQHLEKYKQEWLCNYSNFDFVDEWYNPIYEEKSELNNLGLRNEEISSEKNSSVYRIFVVGGSTVFGDGVKIDETIPGYLDREFHDDRLNGIDSIEVINAGINGAVSSVEAKLIREKLIKLQPDLIIVYDGWNDVKSANYNQMREGEKQNEDLWKNRWIDICKEFGQEFDFIIILQPILEQHGKKFLTNQEFTNFYARDKIQVEGYNLDKYRKYIEALNDNCSGAYDFKNILRDVDRGVYFDQGHMTPLGNKIIAEKIHDLSIPIINKNFELIKPQNDIVKEKISNQDTFESEINFSGEYIRNGNFEDRTISNVIAYISEFHDTKFSGTKINNMDTKFTIFNKIDFQNSIIQDSSITRTGFVDANLSNSDFSQNNFSTSQFIRSDFTDANFQASDLRGIKMEDSILRNSNFEKANFEKARFVNIDFTNSMLENSRISGAKFVFCDLSGIDFSSIEIADNNLGNTEFRNSNVQNSIFSKNDMTSIDFSSKDFFAYGEYTHTEAGADLRYTKFVDVDLRKTLFSNFKNDPANTHEQIEEIRNIISVKLDNVKFINANLRQNDMSFMNMRNSEINNSDLSNVSLKNSDLSFSIIKDSNLSEADLEGANLEGVIIQNTNLEDANLKCLNHEICE